MPVILGGAEGDHTVARPAALNRQADRLAARREEHRRIGQGVAGIRLDLVRVGTERADAPAEQDGRAGVRGGVQRHLIPREVGIRPQLLAQRRPRVRFIDVVADDRDGRGIVALADAAGGSIGDHSAADDDVVVGVRVVAAGGGHAPIRSAACVCGHRVDPCPRARYGRLCRRVGAHPRAVGLVRRQYPARAVSSAVGIHRAARASEPRARRATSAPTSTKDAPASM